MSKLNTELLTITQAATMLNVSKDTLRRWDNNNYLKAVRVGKRRDRRYKKEDINNIIREGTS